MPFNASGIFERLFSWVADRDNGIKIRADRMDQEMDGFRDAINTITAGDFPQRGQVRGVNGSATEPAFTFDIDRDTGVYRVSADALGIAVGGQKRAEINNQGLTVTGTITGALEGNASTATNAANLEGQDSAFYRNAGNLNAGTVPQARLSGSYNIDVTGTLRHSDGYLVIDSFNTTNHFDGSRAELWYRGPDRRVTMFARDDEGASGAIDLFLHDGKVWHSGNDGVGSGLNADLLDGVQGSSYARSDINENFSGNITVENSEPRFHLSESDTNTDARLVLSAGLCVLQVGGSGQGATTSSGNLRFSGYNGTDIGDFRVRHSGGNRIIWHSGNDGTGSGLDADVLDGQHGSFYQNASNLNAGTISDARLPSTITSDITGNAATATAASDTTNLAGRSASFYRNASNLNAGTLSSSRLSGTYNISITGGVQAGISDIRGELNHNSNYFRIYPFNDSTTHQDGSRAECFYSGPTGRLSFFVRNGDGSTRPIDIQAGNNSYYHEGNVGTLFARPAIRRSSEQLLFMPGNSSYTRAGTGRVVTGIRRSTNNNCDAFAHHALQIQRHDGVWVTMTG